MLEAVVEVPGILLCLQVLKFAVGLPLLEPRVFSWKKNEKHKEINKLFEAFEP